jgi:3-hydroxy-9,10-secoandrosta-1,3,5(10)-triene-9,17-dione monooxygenase
VAATLAERARHLVPALRERASATSANRRLLPETVADLQASGLLRVLQAPRNGGYGLGLAVHLEVTSALARGCGSTAWVVGVVHAHSWMMSHFPEAAQDHVYGRDPDAVVCAVVAPRGRAVRVPGGYRLRGEWPFASGSEVSQYLFLGATVVEDGQDVDVAELLVPSSAVAYRDDWHVHGLAGTGSCTVVADDVEVPEAHALSMPALMAGETPGAALHTEGWNQRAPAVPVLVLALAGPALGLARQALDDFAASVGQRTIAYTGQAQREHPTTHLHLARATVLVDQAELHLRRAADVIDEHALAGTRPDLLTRARTRADCAEAVRDCLEAVELLWRDTGGSGLYATNPVGRAVADLQAMNLHAALALDAAREAYGRALLGLPPASTLL